MIHVYLQGNPFHVRGFCASITDPHTLLLRLFSMTARNFTLDSSEMGMLFFWIECHTIRCIPVNYNSGTVLYINFTSPPYEFRRPEIIYDIFYRMDQ